MQKPRSKTQAEITILTPTNTFRGQSFQSNIPTKSGLVSQSERFEQNKTTKNNKKFLKVYSAGVGVPTPSSISLGESSEKLLIDNLRLNLEKYLRIEKKEEERTFSGIQTPIEKITNIFKEFDDEDMNKENEIFERVTDMKEGEK